VAAVIVDAARVARADAQRLRADCEELKLAVRATARITRARTSRAAASAAGARARCASPLASPWSGLAWLREDEDLSRVLLPVE
jgi:hypothetical protein